jgi:hypothetical protein
MCLMTLRKQINKGAEHKGANECYQVTYRTKAKQLVRNKETTLIAATEGKVWICGHGACRFPQRRRTNAK